jgi:energy-coupling factor transporter ATP-binding protein EcfA2
VAVILRNLCVKGLGCFRNPVELSGLGVGAHVIFAPNETGKSTLVLALARALFDRYKAQGEEMLQLRPWGTSLAPEIVVELETGGSRYRLRKRFLDDAVSELDEWRAGRFERLAEAQQSDELVRSFFMGDAAGKGATDLGHWGLARLLWLTQRSDRRILPSLNEPLRQRLRTTVGAIALSEQEQALLAAIEALHGEFWSASGKPRKNSALAQAEEKQRALEGERARLSSQADQVDAWTEQIARAEQTQAECERERAGRVAELAETEAQAKEQDKIERAAEAQHKEAEVLRVRFEKLEGHRQEQEELTKKIADLRKDAAALQPQIAKAEQALRNAAAGFEAAAKTVKEKALRVEAIEHDLAAARARGDAARLGKDHAALGKHLEDATRLAIRRDELHAALTERPGPSDVEVKRAEALQKKSEKDAAQLEALGIELTIASDEARAVTWEAHEGPVRRDLSALEPVSFRGADRGTLTLPGVGRISVRTGVKDAAEIEAQLAKAKEDLAGLLGKHGVEDVAALQAARQEARNREGRIQALEDQIAATPGNNETIEGARTAHRALAGKLAAAAARVGQAPPEIVEPGPGEIDTLERVLKEARKGRGLAEKAREVAEEGRAEDEKALRKVTRERDDAVQGATTLEAQRAARVEAVGSLAEVADGAGKAAADRALAEAAAKALEARLPPPFARASTRLGNLRQALAALDEATQDARRQADGARALVDRASEEGIYSRLTQVEEELAMARHRQSALASRAQAAELLHRLAKARQEQAERSVSGPIEEEVRKRLDYLRGAPAAASKVVFGDLEEAHVQVPARSAGDTPSEAPLEALSFGAQEQVMLAVRLALGELLAEKGTGAEPQLVVLDDVLVNSDPSRHKRALELVGAAAERLQILILTAFPERYRALNAAMHDLEAIKGA